MRHSIPAVQTYVNLVTIDLSCHKGFGASFDCEVEFSMTRVYPATQYEPSYGGEIEVLSVRPYEHSIVEATGFMGTERHYLDCPKWLSGLLLECIDTDALDVEAD